jgi:hypothetical protein
MARRESATNANPGSFVVYVAAKPAEIGIRKFEGAQFMLEHIMGDKIKSIIKFKVYSISLTLTADNRSQVVKKCHQIDICGFCSTEAILSGMKFGIMLCMIGKKEFREIVENRNRSVVAHDGMISCVKY